MKRFEVEFLGNNSLSGQDPATGLKFQFKPHVKFRRKILSERAVSVILLQRPDEFRVLKEINEDNEVVAVSEEAMPVGSGAHVITKVPAPIAFYGTYPVEISVVTGTYNRLKLLKEMLKGLKKAIGDITHEIIVVDGGSTDGTREWLLKQDILTIMEPKLLGACVAFNRGFYAARGKYVVHLNDDIKLKPDTITKCHDYMEERKHRNVGQLAFDFKAPHEDSYHTEEVFGVTYANIGMTRRELGDECGWWGIDYHTYGGDTELSLKITELGYTVESTKHMKVEDIRVEDNLRASNEARKVQGTHPDTKRFWKKWKNYL